MIKNKLSGIAGSPGGTTSQVSKYRKAEEGRVEEVTDEPLYRDRVCGIDIGKAGLVATIRVPSDRDPARRMQETRSFGTTKNEVLALADWLRSWQVPAVVMEATGARLLERPVLPAGGRRVRLRASRRQAGQEPARPAQAGPGRFPLAGGVLRARRRHLLLRGHPGVPDHPAAHPVPAGPDRGAHPGEAARGEAAGISRDQDLQRPDRPARRHRPGHHGSPDRRGAQPQGAGPARPRRRPPQDPPAGRSRGGRGVLHRRACRPAGQGAGPHRPAGRRHR